YALDRSAAGVAIGNTLAFWSHETVDVPLDDGVDEVALALTADAWKRTYRASVRAVSPAAEVRSRHGLILLADGPGAPSVALPPAGTPAIDAVLAAIDRRYGPATADFVALQLEYDTGPAALAAGP
ncbi:MAG TPA: thiamine biosynthesis protein ThiJ, partial [Myxococcota bacterium]|nr:thiamine biosynthesis protein ThiJ [Myxococcota bacterium]